MRRITTITLVLMFAFGFIFAGDDSDVFLLNGGKAWGAITAININEIRGTMSFSGDVRGTNAGYLLTNEVDFDGNIFILKVANARESKFDKYKMFKLLINGEPVMPIRKLIWNAADSNFVNMYNGGITFKITNKVKTIEFVFENVVLNDLQIAGGTLAPEER